MNNQQQSPLMINRIGEVYIVEMLQTSVLDEPVMQRIQQDMEGIIAASGVPKIVLSLSGVTHMASAMIGVLLNVHKQVKARAKKGELRITGLSPQLKELFRITRLDKLLSIYDSTDKAMAKF